MAGLSMRLAKPEDCGRVLEVLDDGRRAIAQLGISQWQDGYPEPAVVEEDIQLGACYVAEDTEHGIVGTLALRLDRDADYLAADSLGWLTLDPDAGDPPYASVHRCAVAEGMAGQGVMSFMFSQVKAIVREAGRESIRIDTHPGNTAMRGFLASQGFAEIGPFELVTHAGSDPARVAYEKRVCTRWFMVQAQGITSKV